MRHNRNLQIVEEKLLLEQQLLKDSDRKLQEEFLNKNDYNYQGYEEKQESITFTEMQKRRNLARLLKEKEKVQESVIVLNGRRVTRRHAIEVILDKDVARPAYKTTMKTGEIFKKGVTAVSSLMHYVGFVIASNQKHEEPEKKTTET